MLLKFTHVWDNDEIKEKNNVLENIYTTRDSLKDKFIVTNTSDRTYSVFESVCKFNEYFSKLKEEKKTYDEVMFDWMPQKLKFDIDMKNKDIPGKSRKDKQSFVDNFMVIMKEKIKEGFFHKYLKDLLDENILITNSSGHDKFSYHIIITGYYVTTNEQAIDFTAHVYKLIPNEYRDFIDLTVNKQLQNFRMCGSHKPKSPTRVKKIITNHTFLDSIITYTVGCVELPSKIKSNTQGNDQGKNVDNYSDEIDDTLCINIIEYINKEHPEILKNLTFRIRMSNLLIFDRNAPSHCELCNETHHNDNTTMIATKLDGSNCKIYFKCRHCTGASKYLGALDTNSSEASKRCINRIDVLLEMAGKYGIKTLFDSLPLSQKNVYSNKSMKDFEHRKTLCVKGRMKMGKTKALVNYVSKHFNNKLYDNKIRILSFRQTFSANIKEKFPEFTLYSDVAGELNQSKLIIQVESLHRLKIDPGMEPPDLLVLDECESIFEQFNSGLLKNFSAAWATFQYLLRNTKYVVAMDANLSDRTYRLMQLMRCDSSESSIYYHCNTYQNGIEDTHYITTDKTVWLSNLYKKLDAGMRIAIPMSSLSFAEVVHSMLKGRYKDKKIKLYSSKTSQSEKKEHFSSIHNFWNQYDVLIYTPTVSAGVSFELEHYDSMFAYFTDMSCGVETAIQMMGRIRNLKNKDYYVCLDAGINNLPTKLETIKRRLYESRAALFKTIDTDNSMLSFNYTPEGGIKYQENEYFYLWLENVRIKNLSSNDYARRYIEYTSDNGSSIEILTTDEMLVSNKDIISQRNEITEAYDTEITAAPDIDPNQVDEIKAKIMDNAALSHEEKIAYERYKLRRDYNWSGDINSVFVSEYRRHKTVRAFKNLRRIHTDYNKELTPKDFILRSLVRIQKEEREQCIEIMESDSKYNDLTRRYVFDQHRITLGLLKICGWENFMYDKKMHHLDSLFSNIRRNEQKILNSISEVREKFGIKMFSHESMKFKKDMKQADYIEKFVKVINKIITSMYGVKIKNYLSDKTIFQISKSAKFSYSYDQSSKPCVLPTQYTILVGIEEQVPDDMLD